jgi:hypothetical protein
VAEGLNRSAGLPFAAHGITGDLECDNVPEGNDLTLGAGRIEREGLLTLPANHRTIDG